jgi:hypothetical protein
VVTSSSTTTNIGMVYVYSLYFKSIGFRLSSKVDLFSCYGNQVKEAHLEMSRAMVLEVGGGGKTLATLGTLVRLLACVDPPMCGQRTERGERLAAEFTSVRFLACLNTTNILVIAQCA